MIKTKEELAEETYPYATSSTEYTKVYVNAYRGAFINGYDAALANLNLEALEKEYYKSRSTRNSGIVYDVFEFIKNKIK